MTTAWLIYELVRVLRVGLSALLLQFELKHFLFDRKRLWGNWKRHFRAGDGEKIKYNMEHTTQGKHRKQWTATGTGEGRAGKGRAGQGRTRRLVSQSGRKQPKQQVTIQVCSEPAGWGLLQNYMYVIWRPVVCSCVCVRSSLWAWKRQHCGLSVWSRMMGWLLVLHFGRRKY